MSQSPHGNLYLLHYYDDEWDNEEKSEIQYTFLKNLPRLQFHSIWVEYHSNLQQDQSLLEHLQL